MGMISTKRNCYVTSWISCRKLNVFLLLQILLWSMNRSDGIFYLSLPFIMRHWLTGVAPPPPNTEKHSSNNVKHFNFRSHYVQSIWQHLVLNDSYSKLFKVNNTLFVLDHMSKSMWHVGHLIVKTKWTIWKVDNKKDHHCSIITYKNNTLQRLWFVSSWKV